jgi:hypothetical protein
MKKLWFKKKKIGYGWQPASKEGWIVTIVFIISIINAAMKYADSNQTMLLVSIVVLTSIFMLIAYKTGEKPSWSWGLKKK